MTSFIVIVFLLSFFFQRPDVIELVNHEAILAQAKEDMKLEKSAAIRTAIEKERADCVAKLDHELRLARQVVQERERKIELYRIREAALMEECTWYKNTITRLTKCENLSREALNEKVWISFQTDFP